MIQPEDASCLECHASVPQGADRGEGQTLSMWLGQ